MKHNVSITSLQLGKLLPGITSEWRGTISDMRPFILTVADCVDDFKLEVNIGRKSHVFENISGAKLLSLIADIGYCDELTDNDVKTIIDSMGSSDVLQPVAIVDLMNGVSAISKQRRY